MADYYLGFDLSTQQLKGIVIKSDLKLVHEAKVDFDADLAHHGIHKGVLSNPSEGEIFAPVAMWLEAVDLVLARLQEQGLNFGMVKAVSGAGMQHGTVFWSERAEQIMGHDLLSDENRQKPLAEVLKDAFSHPFSPNWQDASTQVQCDAFDAHLGSPEVLAEETGSKAHHRFSGPQILRFQQKHPEAYQKTSRISLVSSFLASVFLGKVAPFDVSDVGGMNLWDIKNKKWHTKLLDLAAGKDTAESLRKKLGEVSLDGGESFGTISPYFSKKYGFPSDCTIIPFTGDNPSTLLALPLKASDAIVSLGTSTTFLMSTPNFVPDPSYHFMNHPSQSDLYMFMLCYKNGGLAREHIRDALNAQDQTQKDSKSWDLFNTTADTSPVLGQSNPETDPALLGLFFPRPEIVPNVPAGTWRYLYDGSSNKLSPVETEGSKWPIPKADARAIVESQFLSLRLRSRNLVTAQQTADGQPLPAQPRRVYLVGGGSNNSTIADLAGQVLGGAEGVYRLDIGGNACALGAAYKACWGRERSPNESFEALIGKRWNEEGFVKKIADGYRKGVWERYGKVVDAFESLEKTAIAETSHK